MHLYDVTGKEVENSFRQKSPKNDRVPVRLGAGTRSKSNRNRRNISLLTPISRKKNNAWSQWSLSSIDTKRN